MLQSLGLQRVGHDLATEQQYTGYYLALKKKKKKILTDTTIWMNLEDTMLCEIGWQKQDTSCVIPPAEGSG